MRLLLVLLLCAPGFVIPADGLLAHFDAADTATLHIEGDRVLAWTSKTGAGYVAAASGSTCPVYLSRPAGALRPTLFFDGLDDVLSVRGFDQNAETWSLVMVAAPCSPARGGALCSASPVTGHDYDPGFTVDLYGASTSFDQISIEGAGRIGGQLDQMKAGYPCGGLHVISVLRSGETVELYVDGQLEGSRPVSPAVTVMDTLRIGARFFDGQVRNWFHGEIATLMLYERALTEAERAEVEAALRVSPDEQLQGEQAFQERVAQQRRERMKAPVIEKSWPTIKDFLAGGNEALNPAGLPIRTDLREAIALSVQHMNSLFDRDRDNEPYFFVNREADGTGKMRHSVNIGIPHVVGRCLLACMMAERLAGVPFPEDGLAILERYCRSSFENEDHLNSYYDPEQGGKRFVEFHNMREGLYGLWALIAGRNSDWAREAAHAMLVSLDSITDEEGHWVIEKASPEARSRWYGVATPNATRLVDALLACHDATGDPLAMKLAGLYAKQGLKTLFLEDGRFAPMERSSGHVHSITSSLSGITDYAVRTQDTAMLESCRRIMDVGVPEYFSSWGWGDEVFPEHPADVIGRGEINQTGDVVRTALLLGGAGWPEYYGLAERYLRGMLLPTQHREQELRAILKDRTDPTDDSERDAVRRSIGGYAMQLPNDRMRAGDWPISTLDITSGAVHAMSECYRQRTTVKNGLYRMNLLFDYEDEALILRSSLPNAGRIEFQTKQSIRGLLIRVPVGMDRSGIQLTLGQKSLPVVIEGGAVALGELAANAAGVLSFELPVLREKETVDGVEYTTTWVGEQIIEILPRGSESPLPF